MSRISLPLFGSGLRYAIKRGHPVRAQKSHPRSGEQSYPIDLLRWRARGWRGGVVVDVRVTGPRVAAASAPQRAACMHLPGPSPPPPRHTSDATSRTSTNIYAHCKYDYAKHTSTGVLASKVYFPGEFSRQSNTDHSQTPNLYIKISRLGS